MVAPNAATLSKDVAWAVARLMPVDAIRPGTIRKPPPMPKKPAAEPTPAPAMPTRGDIDQFSREEAVRAAHYLAHVVGNAHGWQMDEATRSGWRDEVLRGTDGGSQAPSWLWSSVVELAGRHEVGYLQHCLRYATAEAA